MKPFNLEAAKAGKPLVTMDGRKVTKFTPFDVPGADYKNAAIIGDSIQTFTDTGRYNVQRETDYDLFLADEEVTVWVNVFEGQSSDSLKAGYILHKTKHEAEKDTERLIGYIGAFPLTIKL